METREKILVFWKTEAPKKFLIFQESGLSYILGNENLQRNSL